jgi:HAD superfamily hydrolase (TIGR01509 family)
VAGAIDALACATCVASSGTHEKMALTLGLTELLGRFEGRIFSTTEVEHGKPAPDLFLHAAASLGADPARCAVVEDSVYGVQAARAAGMRAYGYAGGLTAPDRLAGPGTTVFSDMRELPALLRATS